MKSQSTRRCITWRRWPKSNCPIPRRTRRTCSSGTARGGTTISLPSGVDLKQFRQQNQTRSLSFASAEELGELLGLIPGAVTPLGLLNDGDRRVSFYLDASFCRPEAQKIGVHPNDNTATLWLQVEDLLRLIRAHGNPVHVVPI